MPVGSIQFKNNRILAQKQGNDEPIAAIAQRSCARDQKTKSVLDPVELQIEKITSAVQNL